jgi:molybdenum-dependent DNA-binding transcriptional regulator ModE
MGFVRASLGRKNVGLYPLGSIELIKENVVCTSRNSEWKLQASLTDFAKMIVQDNGFWESLVAAVEDAKQERGIRPNEARRLASR